MANIHSTAIVDESAVLAEDVEVGPYCIIEGGVSIGAGCRLMSHSIVRRYTTMGANNFLDSHVVLGGLPQDLKFDPADVSYLEIGDNNVFREFVTISRATGKENATVIGNGTYWMTQAHAGHNAVVEDGVIMVNNAAVGGHATVGRNAILAGCVMVHQFCWVGEGVMTQGLAGTSTHVPPFVMLAAGMNTVVGLNRVGLARNKNLTAEDRRQIQEAFAILYRGGHTTGKALELMDACTDWGAPAQSFRNFVRKVLEAKRPYARGICPIRRKRRCN